MKCPNCDRDYDPEYYEKWQEEHPECPVKYSWKSDLIEHMHQFHGWKLDDILRYISSKQKEKESQDKHRKRST